MVVTAYFISVPSPGLAIAGWFMICLGGAAFIMAGAAAVSVSYWASGDNCLYHFLLFIPLLPCSPAIFIFIKLIAAIKENNKFIQSQASFASRGEAILDHSGGFGHYYPGVCYQMALASLRR